MSYATRAQLLDRCNLQRLAQLAVPTASVMPSAVEVRDALLGTAPPPVDPAVAAAVADAVVAVDMALSDAADLMRSHGVPDAATLTPPVPQALVRVNCQLAMHYLVERAGLLAESDSANYTALLKLLRQHASGELSLLPPPASGSSSTPSTAEIASAPSRYGVQA